jgi:glycosyltransferase involved in cell wall biosynthesis
MKKIKNKKILINGVVEGEGDIIAGWFLKIKNWQTLGVDITFFGNDFYRKKLQRSRMFKPFKFIELKNTKPMSSANKFLFLFEALRRNFFALFYINKLKNKYDLIYSLSSTLDFVILPFFLKKNDKKIKWVTVFDNTVPFTIPGNKIIRFLAWLFFQISLILLKKADLIFTISNDLKNYLLKKGFPRKQIVVTGNGVDVDLIKRAKKDKKYNFDTLFVGRINEDKGIYHLLEVVNIVKGGKPRFQLAIMGRGDEATEKQFKYTIKKRGLEKNIRFLGYKTGFEKFSILKSCRCFLFLSLNESFGVALLEAVCCGLPAIAYDLPPYKNIYKNNEVAFFKENDFHSIAQKLIKILNQKPKENVSGKQLLNQYRWDRIAKIEFKAMQNLN